MNFRSQWVFFLLLAIGVNFPACSSPPTSASDDYAFSAEEVVRFERDALKGGQDSAVQLIWVSLDEGKKEEAIFWAQVAMENGSAVGRHNYASLLAQRGDFRSLSRAKYHLDYLASQGDGDAKVLLKDVERKIAALKVSN